MSKSLLWKRLLIWSVCLWGLAYALPNVFHGQVEAANDARAALAQHEAAPSGTDPGLWPRWLPSSLVNLGLDLRGGAHLLAEVQVDDVYAARMTALWPSLRDRLTRLHPPVGPIARLPADPGVLRIRIGDAAGLDAALAAVRDAVATQDGSGVVVRPDGDVLVVELTPTERTAIAARTVQQSLEIVRRRVDEAGTREPTILREGEDRISIDVPGMRSAAELKDLIGTTALLSFHSVTGTAARTDHPAPGKIILPETGRTGAFLVLDEVPVITGESLSDAHAAFDQDGRPSVNFRLETAAARAFGDYTASHVGQRFAIVLDGEVISAPVIQNAIPGGAGMITGNFTPETANDLAILLRAGALPAKLTFLEERTVGPELGQDSIDAGKNAAVAGMAAVVAFMIACYGGFGVMASVALALNLTLLIALLSVLGATLTLPGIAGIVLTMGMAVDANVLIFERIREELGAGRTPRQAIGSGFERAFSAILDSNLTGLIAAAILYLVGTGPVRGFAVTTGLGILTSMFTAVYVTRSIIELWLNRRQPRTLRLSGWLRLVPDHTRIDFFRLQRVTFGASVAAVLASFLLFATVGMNFGIDFRGGTTFRVESAQPVDVGGYRAALADLGLGDVAITEVFDPSFAPDQHVATVRIQAQGADEAVSPQTIRKVEDTLTAVDPGIRFTSVESVGAKVSGEMIWLALGAVGAGSLAILAYVWLRFEWQFAVGAVAALLHDVIVTAGVFSLFQLKFDLTTVAALLTILGYSVNDTVVVFDRLRENLARDRTSPLRDLMNLSANETLTRTIMTSSTTLIALLALLLLGGDVIRGFVFALLFGVVVGTYSTLYVAKNIVLFLGVDRRGRAERRVTHEFERIGA